MSVILSDITVTLSYDELLDIIQKNPDTSSLLKDEAKIAAAAACECCEPVAIYEWMSVFKWETERLRVFKTKEDSEFILNIGSSANLLKPANLILVCVYSIGEKLDERIALYHQSGNHMQSYLLDCAGLAVLEKTGAAVRKIAEHEAAKRRWGVSAVFSPGSLKGWDISFQSEIAAILDLSLIRVKLNEASVLVPYKSVSCIIGIGPGYTDSTVGAVCKSCSIADTCSQRKLKTERFCL